MIQLSSPQPESIPVHTGKSPEKAAPSPTGDGRFERALEQSRTVSRSDKSPESVKAERKRTSLRTEKGSKKSEKKPSAGDRNEDAAARVTAKKKGRDRMAAEVLEGTDAEEKGADLLSLITSKQAVKSEKKINTPRLSEAGPSAAGSDEKGNALTVGQLLAEASAGKAGSSEAAGHAEPPLPAGDISAAAVVSELPESGADAEINDLLRNALSGEQKGRVSPLAPRLAKKGGAAHQKKSAGPEITLDDRRTPSAAEDGIVLKRVEHNAETGSMTLELTPGTEEELPGMMLRTDGDGASAAKFSLQTAEESKGAALLDRQLKNEGTAELTKNIRFVLKDNKEGEIKLILKPEALGKVRINLNLNENNIVGKIIVENNSVRQVFMNNLADLSRALEDSGFNSAALDVSVGGGQSEGRGAYGDEGPVDFTDNALDDLEDMIPVVYDEGHSLSQVNLMV
jgi:flagellar hook-length control protein FliK